MGWLTIGIIVFGMDQLSKIFLYGIDKSLIGDFLWLKTVFNDGAAWGMFSGARWVFIIVSSIMAVLIVYLLLSKRFFNSKFFKLSLAILFGGLLGNLYDRIFLGGVRDFIFLKSINFPVFNVADIAITIGTIMLVIYILFLHNKNPKIEKQILTKESE